MGGLIALTLAVALHKGLPAEFPQPAFKSRWLVTGFVGGSLVPFLGAEDPRTMRGFGIQYARPNRRLRFRQIPAELVFEGNYTWSSSPGVSQQPANSTDAYGLMAFARYRWPAKRGVSFYADIGWGLQYASMRTVDLNSRLNSTPILGAGLAFRAGDQEVLLGARFVHISNAGLEGDNQGQNQFAATVTVRF